jgi:ubiquinone/menaquinone biosynthesis C-methylase UbiE
VNEGHLRHLASPEWRTYLREEQLPWVIGSYDLGDDCLEVGPGPGLTTDELRLNAARVTAVEVDDALATALTQRLAGTNVSVVLADATSIPFPDGSFSGAAIFTMLHHVETLEAQDQVLAEVCRVLRPGGLLVGCDSLDTPEIRAGHADDVFLPIDPASFPDRLRAAGFGAVETKTRGYSQRFAARKPGR